MTSKKKQVRKPFARGFRQALTSLERLAANLHAEQLAGQKLETGGTTVLREALTLQELVYGSPALPTLMLLGDQHLALGEAADASQVYEDIADRQRQEGGELSTPLAGTLRKLALAYKQDGRAEDAGKMHALSLLILRDLVNQPELFALLCTLLRDESDDNGFDYREDPGNAAAKTSGQGVDTFRRGQIWWAKFPQFPNDPHQPRPAVIVSTERTAGFRVHVIPLYSKAQDNKFDVPIPAAATGLGRDSIAKCNNLTALDPQLLTGRAGSKVLSENLLKELLRRSQQLLE
jgi:mRNA-degrading endonuclease toxin of MazEF toxin-antitoxin module